MCSQKIKTKRKTILVLIEPLCWWMVRKYIQVRSEPSTGQEGNAVFNLFAALSPTSLSLSVCPSLVPRTVHVGELAALLPRVFVILSGKNER